MKSVKCSKCGLVNFANSEICKRCNTRILFSQTAPQFNGQHSAATSTGVTNRVTAESFWENSGFRKIIYGLLWITGGSLLTYYTNSIFYGAIIFGVIDVFRGIAGMFTDND